METQEGLVNVSWIHRKLYSFYEAIVLDNKKKGGEGGFNREVPLLCIRRG